MRPLEYTNLSKIKKNDLFNLIEDINGMDKNVTFNDSFFNNHHKPIIKKQENYNNHYNDHYDNQNRCNMCRSYENIIAFYHKLAFIIILGLLLKFVLDSMNNK